MPFTPTHILAVLPFMPLRHRVPWAALVIGSMIPDLGIIVAAIDYAQTHSISGIVTHCIPLGMLVYGFYFLVGRLPWILLLPEWFRARMRPSARDSNRQLLDLLVMAPLAVGVGAATHVFWDSFTHRDRWGTTVMPFLSEQHRVGIWDLANYKLFQYGSTIVGLPILAACLWRFASRRIPVPADERPTISPALRYCVWFILLSIPVACSVMAIEPDRSMKAMLGRTVRWSGWWAMVVLIGYASISWCWIRDPRAAPSDQNA